MSEFLHREHGTSLNYSAADLASDEQIVGSENELID